MYGGPGHVETRGREGTCRGGSQVFCSVILYLVPWMQSFTRPGARLVTSKPQLPSCLCPATCSGGLQEPSFLCEYWEFELSFSCLHRRCSYLWSHLPPPMICTCSIVYYQTYHSMYRKRISFFLSFFPSVWDRQKGTLAGLG